MESSARHGKGVESSVKEIFEKSKSHEGGSGQKCQAWSLCEGAGIPERLALIKRETGWASARSGR